MKSVFILIIYALLHTHSASARVFDFKSNWVSAYLRGTLGESELSKNLYGDTSGHATVFSESVKYNTSAEVGFAFQLDESLVIRTSIEGIQSKNVNAIGRKSSTDAKYLDVESQMTAFNPNLNIEVALLSTNRSRVFIYGGAGYSTVKVGNEYSLQALATTDYTVASNYKEGWEGSAISYQGGVGYELFMVDNVTLSIDAGYRLLEVSKFKHNATATVIRAGGASNVTDGETVLDDNGKKIKLDLNGAYIGIAFKFYIPPLH